MPRKVKIEEMSEQTTKNPEEPKEKLFNSIPIDNSYRSFEYLLPFKNLTFYLSIRIENELIVEFPDHSLDLLNGLKNSNHFHGDTFFHLNLHEFLHFCL